MELKFDDGPLKTCRQIFKKKNFFDDDDEETPLFPTVIMINNFYLYINIRNIVYNRIIYYIK
jgi:hypothetical protein